MIGMWLYVFSRTMQWSHRINVYAIDGAMVGRISILNWIHLTASVVVNTKTTPLRFDRSNRKQLLFEVSVNLYKNTTDNLSIKTKGVFFSLVTTSWMQCVFRLYFSVYRYAYEFIWMKFVFKFNENIRFSCHKHLESDRRHIQVNWTKCLCIFFSLVRSQILLTDYK